MNQSARRDDTRRDAPLRYVRPASYCEPDFMDVMRAMSVMLVMRAMCAMRVVRVMRVLPLLRVMRVMRVMRVLRVMRVYPYESRTSLGGNESHCSVPIVPMEMKVDLRPITGKRKYKV